MAPAPLLTTDDYLQTPETLNPTELIYGALRIADAPAPRHQQAVGAFHLALAPHVRERRLGRVLLSPLDVIFDWDRALILQPDLVFISHARWEIRRQKIVGALGWFAEYGVREIWLLHQLREQFELLVLQNTRVVRREVSDYLAPIRSDVLPEFTITVEDILRE